MLLALKNIKGEVVDRPKALGDIRGVTYIYGMFYRFGLIDVPDEVKEKMGRPIRPQKIGCYVQKCAVICAVTEVEAFRSGKRSWTGGGVCSHYSGFSACFFFGAILCPE